MAKKNPAYVHVKTRLRQRYNLDINEEEWEMIGNWIKSNRGVDEFIFPLEVKTKSRTIHLVLFKGEWIPFVYSKNTKVVMTALPRRVLSKYDITDRTSFKIFSQTIKKPNELIFKNEEIGRFKSSQIKIVKDLLKYGSNYSEHIECVLKISNRVRIFYILTVFYKGYILYNSKQKTVNKISKEEFNVYCNEVRHKNCLCTIQKD